MSKKYLAPMIGVFVVVVIVGVILVSQVFAAKEPAAQAVGSSDPQRLLIPRWFLTGLTLDGKQVAIAEGQQKITIQFKEDGSVNGTGGCNSFGGTYKAGSDGKISFSELASTLMACDGDMEAESAYFTALGKVQQFKTDQGQLTFTSADGKTTLVFHMPPK
jgi:heat shock protein HslJ